MISLLKKTIMGKVNGIKTWNIRSGMEKPKRRRRKRKEAIVRKYFFA